MRRTMTGWALLATAGLVLASCTSVGQPSESPAVPQQAPGSASADAGRNLTATDLRQAGDAAPAADPAATLPFTWEESTLVETGWSVAPRFRDNIFVSFSAPSDADAGGPLRYSAVDAYGTVLWRATRPATCTGFAVSMASERPMVVLTDARADDGGWQTTASGYDLATGERLWGPRDVPGTVQGPGLVFGASAPASTMGAVGPRVALDPATGEVVADERREPGLQVVGEYDGTVLIRRSGMLVAIEAASGAPEWSRPASSDRSAAPAGMTAPRGAALVAGDSVGSGARLIDLADGRVIGSDVQGAGFEGLSHTWVWSSGSTVHSASRWHDPWVRTFDGPVEIAAVGTGLVYLRVGKRAQVLNAVTGRDAVAYPDQITGAGYALPLGISTFAASVFDIDGHVLLATVERPPE